MEDGTISGDLLPLVFNVLSNQSTIKSFDDLMKFRLSWVESESFKPSLIMLEDKLWQRSGLAGPAKVKCPRLMKAFGEEDTAENVAATLVQLLRDGNEMIVKPTHLLAGRGVVILTPPGEIRYYCLHIKNFLSLTYYLQRVAAQPHNLHFTRTTVMLTSSN